MQILIEKLETKVASVYQGHWRHEITDLFNQLKAKAAELESKAAPAALTSPEAPASTPETQSENAS
jgi:hypothetical protein